MNRKSTERSQFSIFHDNILLDRKPSFLQDDDAEEPISKPVKTVKEEHVSDVDVEPVPAPIETLMEPVEEEEPETNELLKEDPERKLINRDFADGYQGQSEAELPAVTTTTVLLSPGFGRALKVTMIAILLFVILLLVNWQSWVLESPLFTVKNIEVRGQFLSTREEILKLADVETGGRLSEVDVNLVSARVMKHPMFENVAVSRAYPSTIVITVLERRPVAFLNTDPMYAIDGKGIVMPRLRPSQIYNLPTLSGIGQSVTPGKPLSQTDVPEALDFLEVVKSVDPVMYNEISEVLVRKDSYLIQLNSLPVLFRINRSEKTRSAVYLTAAYRLFRQKDLRNIREIDCRYDGHVIAVEKKS